ncbi:MAG: GNAT family N-acetyltransferase [Actinobacteria bacterium]|nr:GNAT family N-acetyltransferase [Actinomycetota bacterium]
MGLEFHAWSSIDEPAASLLDAAEAHLIDLYGPRDSALRPELFCPPDGGYLIGWEDGQAIAGGGFTRHDPTTAEIRRMYVAPSSRSRGVARGLLAAIERAAFAAGYERAILDTGPKQPHAEALYRSAGFSEIDNYREGRSRGSFWGEKPLN